MTYRERREAKAERLRGWAASREAKAAAELARATERASAIPFGQPILVGHHSEGRDRNYRAKISRGFERSFEHANKAADMSRRADGIEAAADRAIYSDDVDAVDRLRERVAELEHERNRWKAYNAACRAGDVDAARFLDERQKRKLGSTLGQHAPAYVLSNLGGNITRNRKRLVELERRARAEGAF